MCIECIKLNKKCGSCALMNRMELYIEEQEKLNLPASESHLGMLKYAMKFLKEPEKKKEDSVSHNIEETHCKRAEDTAKHYIISLMLATITCLIVIIVLVKLWNTL